MEEKTTSPATVIEAKTEAVHEKEVVEDQGRENSPESTKLSDDSIQMHVIGEDDNVKVKVLDIAAISNVSTPKSTRVSRFHSIFLNLCKLLWKKPCFLFQVLASEQIKGFLLQCCQYIQCTARQN